MKSPLKIKRMARCVPQPKHSIPNSFLFKHGIMYCSKFKIVLFSTTILQKKMIEKLNKQNDIVNQENHKLKEENHIHKHRCYFDEIKKLDKEIIRLKKEA